MGAFRTFGFWGLFVSSMAVQTEAVPTLFVSDVELLGGQNGNLVIEGAINGESTIGVTIIVSLSPHPGAHGEVTFTLAPPVDITQLSDPWPGVGSFNVFDTDLSGSLTLNGSVDDNGTFLMEPLAFSGPLVSLPIAASGGAFGTWDVLLSSPAGDSTWEGVSTVLIHGVIEVPITEGIPAVSTWGSLTAALLVLVCGTILILKRRPSGTPLAR